MLARNGRRQPVFRFVYVALLALVVSACVYIPPVWNAGIAINSVEEIKVGSTSKVEVRKKLSIPTYERKLKTGSLFYYTGTRTSGILIGPFGAARGLVEEDWWVEITFNKSDLVTSVLTTDTANWSREGFHNPNFDIVKNLCSAAGNGSPIALVLLGQFRQYAEPPNKDLSRAYMYYLLGEQAGEPEASDSLLTVVQSEGIEEKVVNRGISLARKWTTESQCP